jgi:hypothetical protein
MNDDKTKIPGTEMQNNIDKVGIHIIKNAAENIAKSIKTKIKSALTIKK